MSASFSLLLVEPRLVRAQRHLLSIQGTNGLTLIGSARDLTAAYNLTEHMQPDAVLLAEEVTRQANFPMFGALLAALEIECLILAHPGSTAADPGFQSISPQDWEAVGGLGPFLANRHLRSKRAVPAKHIASTTNTPKLTYGDAHWKTVLIGASTGGVEALIEILSHYPAHCPPTLIVQHISPSFLSGLAQRLDRHCSAEVRSAHAIDDVRPGLVLMAPGNTQHLTLVPPGRRCRLVAGDPVSGHRPSVDQLFKSGARLGPAMVGVQLTGMGRDGADGLLDMRRAGAWTIGQDESTSAVYGMPRAAMALNAVCEQLPIDQIASAILQAANQKVERSSHE